MGPKESKFDRTLEYMVLHKKNEDGSYEPLLVIDTSKRTLPLPNYYLNKEE